MQNKMETNPIDKKHEVRQSNDKHITQDFENYPQSPASENIINPKNKADKLTAQNGANYKKAKPNPPKNKTAKAGDTTHVEKKLGSSLSDSANAEDAPNKVKRIKKQQK